MIQHETEDEVRFWEGLIKWWESTYYERAPERMYEALDFANSRASNTKQRKSQPGFSVIH